ncbi:MAG: carbamoyltransferase [bacterium]|jgi:carbamoyltransferase|nr:carbamoyltransferase [bacterium]
MNILGISCYYHDSAACLIQDGQVVSAAQEERFNLDKNSPVFPINAINYCLQAGGITVYDVDYIAFYEKPFLKFARVIVNHLRSWPFSIKNFLDTVPPWLEERLIFPLKVKKELGYEGDVLFVKHHLSHAASTFLVSPFEEAAILTVDGVGEWATTSYGTGRGTEIELIKVIHYPDSLGLVYAALTTHLGFAALRGEGKVMGLAPYGTPNYLDRFHEMVEVKPDGSFKLDQSYFGFNQGARMFSRKLVKLFGKPREPETELNERHYDIAASLQKFTEDVLVAMARHIHQETGLEKLCLAGGVFLNCVANTQILEQTPFNEIFIQPAAGDAGGAVGAAAYVYHTLLKNPRSSILTGAYLGPEYTASQIKRALLAHRLEGKNMPEEELLPFVAAQIAEGKIVGWFQGRLEFGPRALGNRSILADPRNPDMKDTLNYRVKHREPFRPYAPSVLEERAEEFFELPGSSPFMLQAPRVVPGKETVVPAITHVDNTARVQTVNRDANPRYWKLIKAFEENTGIPLVLNTSFNLRGEPIVCSPEEAISTFERTEMDLLVLGDFVVAKSAGPDQV